jgi:hypothetical protein
MEPALQRLVRQRAARQCEYCQMPEACDPLPFCVDHIIAQKHHGQTVDDNLALACYHCNTYKGPNVAGIDRETGQLTRLFHPRRDRWDEHFVFHGAELTGHTPVGRATVDVLNINHPDRVEHRRLLIAEGVFPVPSVPAPPPLPSE